MRRKEPEGWRRKFFMKSWKGILEVEKVGTGESLGSGERAPGIREVFLKSGKVFEGRNIESEVSMNSIASNQSLVVTPLADARRRTTALTFDEIF